MCSENIPKNFSLIMWHIKMKKNSLFHRIANCENENEKKNWGKKETQAHKLCTNEINRKNFLSCLKNHLVVFLPFFSVLFLFSFEFFFTFLFYTPHSVPISISNYAAVRNMTNTLCIIRKKKEKKRKQQIKMLILCVNVNRMVENVSIC